MRCWTYCATLLLLAALACAAADVETLEESTTTCQDTISLHKACVGSFGPGHAVCNKAQRVRDTVCNAEDAAALVQHAPKQNEHCHSQSVVGKGQGLPWDSCPVAVLGEAAQEQRASASTLVSFQRTVKKICARESSALPALFTSLVATLRGQPKSAPVAATPAPTARRVSSTPVRRKIITGVVKGRGGYPGTEWAKGAKCGLSQKRINEIERTAKCPKGSHIQRMMICNEFGSCRKAKFDVISILFVLLGSLRTVSSFFQWGKDFLPSARCCLSVPTLTSNPLAWTPEMAKVCCKKHPAAKTLCDTSTLARMKATCKPMVKTYDFERYRGPTIFNGARIQPPGSKKWALIEHRRRYNYKRRDEGIFYDGWTKPMKDFRGRVVSPGAVGRDSYGVKLQHYPGIVGIEPLRCNAYEPKSLKRNFWMTRLGSMAHYNSRESELGTPLDKDPAEEEETMVDWGLGETWGRRRRKRRKRGSTRRRRGGFFKSFKKMAGSVGRSVRSLKNSAVKGMKSFGMKLLKKMLPRLIKMVIKLVPKKYRGVVKKMTPPLLKGKYMQAMRMALPSIKKLVLPWLKKKLNRQWHALFQKAFDQLFKFAAAKTRKARRMILERLGYIALSRIKTLVLEPVLAQAKVQLIKIECFIREYVYPLVNMDYSIRIQSQTLNGELPKKSKGSFKANWVNKPSNPLRTTGNCKGNRAHKDYGDLAVTLYRVTNDNKKVCEFNFNADTHACMPKGKAKCDKFGKCVKGRDCCASSTWAFPRTSSSGYDPAKQVKGHGCKQWYLGVLSMVQAVTGILFTVFSNIQIKNCIVESCSSQERCSASNCNGYSFKDAYGVQKRCKWNANPQPRPTWLRSKGLCQQQRL